MEVYEDRKVTITNLKVLNFRSCKELEFVVDPNLNILIGVNGAGKTNLLKAIELLAAASESRISASKVTDGNEYFPTATIECAFRIDEKELRYKVVVKLSPILARTHKARVVDVKEEWHIKMSPESEWQKISAHLFDSKYAHMGREVVRTHSMVSPPSIVKSFRLLLENEFVKGGFTSEVLMTSISSVERVRKYLRSILTIRATQYTDPTKWPDRLELQDPKTLTFATNYRNEDDSILRGLYTASVRRPEEFADFLSIVGADGLGLFDDIKFEKLELPALDVDFWQEGKLVSRQLFRHIIVPLFIANNRRFAAPQLSDGTLKALSLVYLIVLEKGDLLMLEEPEVCLHHGLLSGLIDLMKAYSDDKQMIVTTHSELLLDKVDAQNVFIVKNEPNLGTQVTGISKALKRKELKALKEFLATTGNLGEYWRQGGF